jgi:hypothetical protein
MGVAVTPPGVGIAPPRHPPGFTAVRRLNRVEFNNTVRDLLGDTRSLADDFPVEAIAEGFDNNAEMLTVVPVLVEKYEVTAKRLIDDALARDASAKTKRLLICTPDAAAPMTCANRILESFARRAWRRPVSPDELTAYASIVRTALEEGEAFAPSVGYALQGILLSPHFLFRIEIDPRPDDDAAHAVSPYELASRLSYFLWSSMPDDDLFALAESGRLLDPEVLTAQVRRMAKDQRADAFVNNFFGQWLTLREIENALPDATLYPGIDASLKAAMRQEVDSVFRALIDENRRYVDVLDLDFTFVNDRLATHYGLPPPGSGATMRRIGVGDTMRRGLLGKGGLLMVTSHQDRTSPVKRGKWVLGQLLCSEPPPPPPNVEGVPPEISPNATLRERLEAHRSHPACASCHATMDPIGFGLENFDAVGRWRTLDNGSPIDASGVVDGKSFNGPSELGRVLQSSSKLNACFLRKLFIYATGRLPLPEDAAALSDLEARFQAAGGRMQNALMLIATSPAFTHRQPTAGDHP